MNITKDWNKLIKRGLSYLDPIDYSKNKNIKNYLIKYMTTKALQPDKQALEAKEKDKFFEIVESIKQAKLSQNMKEELPFFVNQIPDHLQHMLAN